jgi:transglutaminase-like putative cysteine protease
VPLWIVACVCAAYLVALYRQQAMRLGDWAARSPEHPAPGPRPRTAGAGLGLGATALVGAFVVGAALPGSGVQLFDGPGGSGGGQRFAVGDPVADMRRDLRRPSDQPLLQIRTDGGRPSYLRISVLSEFDGAWRVGPRDVPSSQSADGDLPQPPGAMVATEDDEVDYEVRINESFDSRWLPTMDRVVWIDAGEEWRYDLTTRDFLGTDDTSAAGAAYRFTDLQFPLDAARLDDATSSSAGLDAVFTEVPDDLSPEVARLADGVTRGADSRFEGARRLQDWFRRDGGFTYDLSVADSLGSDSEDLLAFLDPEDGRVGYCEQFAAAMAIMARTQGIPARVAVGFLTPEQIGDGLYEYSAWDMHAWPELYFPGSGWVRFEPTPSTRASGVPDYTRDPLDAAPTQEPTPTAPTPTAPSLTAPGRETPGSADSDTGGVRDTVDSVVVLGGLGVVLLAVGAALTPRLVRARRRTAHLAAGPEGAWAELRASVLDLRLDWPEGRSPRQAGAILRRRLPHPASTPEVVAALDRIVEAVEVARYAPSATSTGSTGAVVSAAGTSGAALGTAVRERVVGDLGADVAAVVTALVEGASTRTVRRARWLPRSLWAGPSGQ